MIKKIFREHSFAKMSAFDALRETLELAIMPAVFCLLVSALMLCTGEYADKILAHSVEEFLQLTGLKLTLYSSLITSGFSLILIRAGVIKKILKWVTASICKCGFSFAGVIVGVFTGLAIPAGVDSESLKVVLGFVLIAAFFAFFQVLYFWIVQLAYIEINDEKTILGIKVTKLVPWLGGALILIALFGVFTDKWPEVYGVN